MFSQLNATHTARLMMALGVGLLLIALGGLVLMQALPLQGAARIPPIAGEASPTSAPTNAAERSSGLGAVARDLPFLPSQTPTPTRTPRPSPTPAPTRTLAPTNTPNPTAQPTAGIPTSTLVRPTSVPIVWTEEEKNALSWLCYGEISGMGNAEYDACLSVISTVRARYAYPNGFTETDVIGTLLRPGQFNVPIETAQPAPPPRFLNMVEDYAQGARGSCNGYLYFNSIPGGPSECVIYGAAGLFIQFHNSF